MIEITVVHEGEDTVCPQIEGDSLLLTLQRNGIVLSAPCGGTGRCGKCVVRVNNETAAGRRAPEEDRHAPEGSGTRLACRAFPAASLTVDVRGSELPVAHDVNAKGGTFSVPVEGVPIVQSVEIALAAPSLEDQRSVHARLLDELPHGTSVSLDAVRSAAALMKGEAFLAAGLVATTRHGDMLLTVSSEMSTLLPALAFDIGTTTIAGYLVDLASRRILAVISAENDQRRFGADVVSRISAAADGHDLTGAVRSQIASMAGRLVESGDVRPESVVAATVVGNPTMMHLLFGLDPTTIGKSPFMPVSSESLEAPLESLGIPAMPGARMIAPPAISAYVGADIVADLLAADGREHDGIFLLIDIGTNGEMILVRPDDVFACSTAAGPAFEGATIRCGSGGISGAIDRVSRGGEDLRIRTIGSAPARSICGSGLIDSVALMLEDGIVDQTGRLDADAARGTPVYENRVTTVNGEDAIILSHAGNGAAEVVLTQGDLRQVQLAKGAIAAGVRTLLDTAGVEEGDVSRVFLAGGFGTFVDPARAVRVGLVPAFPDDRIVSLGNAAGAGAVRLLVDRNAWTRADIVARTGTYVELSSSAAFQSYFVEEMMFPQ